MINSWGLRSESEIQEMKWGFLLPEPVFIPPFSLLCLPFPPSTSHSSPSHFNALRRNLLFFRDSQFQFSNLFGKVIIFSNAPLPSIPFWSRTWNELKLFTCFSRNYLSPLSHFPNSKIPLDFWNLLNNAKSE